MRTISRFLTGLTLFWLSVSGVLAQAVFRIDSLPANGVLLDKGWKFHAGDNPEWAKADFDDSSWENIDPTKDITELPKVRKAGIGWLRLNLHIDSTLLQQQAIILQVRQTAGSELYSDEQLILRLGTVSLNAHEVDAVSTTFHSFGLPGAGKSRYALAVRIAVQPNLPYTKFANTANPLYRVQVYAISRIDPLGPQSLWWANYLTYTFVKAGLFFILAFLHLCFFIFYPSQKANLFFAISSLLFFVHWLGLGLNRTSLLSDLDTLMYVGQMRAVLFPVNYICLITALYTAYALPKSYYYWAGVGVCGLLTVIYFLNYQNGVVWIETGSTIVMTAEAIRITVMAVVRKHRGANIILTGMVISFVSLSLRYIIFFTTSLPYSHPDNYAYTFEQFGVLSLPLFLSVYLASEFAFASKSLAAQLVAVKQLSARNLAQEQEKQQILSTQNETLERQVAERTTELEDKNRDLEIEAALEKVRSRSLAMQKSTELQDVVRTVVERMTEMGVNIASANIILFNEHDKGIVSWTKTNTDDVYSNGFQWPYNDDPAVADFFDAIEQRTPLFTKNYTFDEKNAFWKNNFERSDFRNVPADRKKFILDAPYFSFSLACRNKTGICMTRYTEEPFSDSDHDILQRFATVFEQAYTRFLDVQKAENQAREAQVEVALERVRSRTMAMFRSDELSEVTKLLFQQLTQLGRTVDRFSIGIFDEQRQIVQIWATDQAGNQVDRRFIARLSERTTVQKVYDGWKAGKKTLLVDLQGEELQEWIRYAREEMGIVVNVDQLRGRRLNNLAYFSHGYLVIQSIEPIAPELLAILERFAAVFNLTYTRFLDLQKAEANEQKAIRQASLDRVRAEIASMRTTDDLQRITPLIWHELTTLKVQFIRCGVFIMNELTETVQTYLSAPDGHAIASFDLPYNTAGITPQVVAHWREGQPFTDHWDETQFQAWSQNLVDQGLIQSRESYLSDAPPQQLSLYFLPFRQGMLYVGNGTPLTSEELQLTQDLAEAFSTAYARYQDFNRLEDAKLQVEKTLTDLRATQNQLIQKEKMASLGELTAGIAHEIQNPLNFVNNFSEVSTELVDELAEEQQKPDRDTELEAELLGDLKQNLQKINHHGQRASSIVKGMLEHSRATTGERQPTNLNALADEYLRLAYQGLRAKDKGFNTELKTDFDSDLGKVEVVPQEIGRVLLNLFNNAFYAVREKQKTTPADYQPTVTVSTKQVDSGVEIRVRDNGTGITDDVKAKIFQPFFTTKPTGQGTGLGLSLAYDIVTKGHGGTLEVISTAGVGSEFIFQLPIA